MKRIFALLTLVILLVLGNFTLWFWHTRTISESVKVAQAYLNQYNMRLDYKDVTFTNFLAWRTKGIIEDVTLTTGLEDNSTVYKVKRVTITSSPIRRTINVALDDNVYATAMLKGQNHEYEYKFTDPALLEIRLKSSLSDLNNAIRTHNYKLKDHISSVNFKNTAITQFDLSNNNQRITKFEDLHLDVLNDLTAKDNKITVNGGIGKTIHNPDYKTLDPKDQDSYDTSLKTGPVTSHIDFVYQELSSPASADVLKKRFGEKTYEKELKDGVLDAIYIRVNELKVANSLYAIEARGDIKREPYDPVPYLDLDINVQNYPNLIRHYTNLLNTAFDSFSPPVSLHTAVTGKVTDAQVQQLIDIIRSFPVQTSDGNGIHLKIIRNESSTTVSDLPLSEVFKRFQKLFLASLGQDDSSSVGTVNPLTNVAPKSLPLAPSPLVGAKENMQIGKVKE